VKRVIPIIAVIVLLVATALTMLRPGSHGGDPQRPGALIDVVGGLLPVRDVTSADVASQPCWQQGTLTVPPAGTCVTRLPDPATRLTLCVVAGQPDVRVSGTSYGPQRLTLEQLDCAGPRPISLYDDGSRLQVTCVGLTPCVLRLA